MKKQLLNKLFFICIFFLSIQITNAQNFQFQGNITNDTIWAADTLEITGDVLIDSNVTLTVLPGTFVHITGYYSIWSYGTIRAIGTETDSIVFTHLDTLQHADTSTIAGGWHGIRLLPRSSQDTSIFKYCKINNGKSVVPGSFYSNHDAENQGGNIYGIDFGSMILSNCNISNGRVKSDGGGVFLENGDYVAIEQCNFKYNHSYYDIGGGAFIREVDTLYIINCLFNYNTCYFIQEGFEGGQGGGIAIQHALGYTSYALIENNRFFNNKTGVGVIYDAYYRADIIGNVICNNYGAGLWNAHCFNYPVYTNNTIVNNVGYVWSGVQILSPNVTLINNIIWRNFIEPHYPADQIWYEFSGNPPIVKYCNVMFGYEGEGNIDSLPLFTNPTADIGPSYDALNADWSLTDESPCVNTGTPDTSGLFLPDYDIEGNPRIYGSRIDMGAYENQVFTLIEPVLQKIIFTSVYPNPGTNHLNIKTKLINSTFELTDFTGKIIIRTSLNSFTKQINTSNIPSGMYFYRILNNEKIIECGKWVKQ